MLWLLVLDVIVIVVLLEVVVLGTGTSSTVQYSSVSRRTAVKAVPRRVGASGKELLELISHIHM
jgi:hypothetical protein